MNNEELFKHVLGNKIRDKRNAMGLTLEDLAHLVKRDDKHLARIERGEKSPGAYTLALLQIALDLNSDEYLNEFLNSKRREKK